MIIKTIAFGHLLLIFQNKHLKVNIVQCYPQMLFSTLKEEKE